MREGATVVIGARGRYKLLQAYERLLDVAGSDKLLAMPMHVGIPSNIEWFVSRINRQLGPVSILVNNAGITGPIGPLEQVPWNQFQEVMQTNLYGPIHMYRALSENLKQTKGSIINIAGGGATAPRPHFVAYALTKTAIVRLTETLALELENTGIRVNAVAPGRLNTAMTREIAAAGYELDAKPYNSIQRAADLCCWLASDESRPLTGRLISAVWDPWDRPGFREQQGENYTLRRVVP